MDPIKVGDRFQHFKTGGYYTIVSLFTWESTKEPAVLYESEKTGERWGRTVKNFLEEVAKDDKSIPRFSKKSDGEQALPLYGLDEKLDENNRPYWTVIHWSGSPIATLKGGTSQIIVLSFLNMSKQGQRGNDYMAGVIQGLTHMQLLKQE